MMEKKAYIKPEVSIMDVDMDNAIMQTSGCAGKLEEVNGFDDEDAYGFDEE